MNPKLTDRRAFLGQLAAFAALSSLPAIAAPEPRCRYVFNSVVASHDMPWRVVRDSLLEWMREQDGLGCLSERIADEDAVRYAWFEMLDDGGPVPAHERVYLTRDLLWSLWRDRHDDPSARLKPGEALHRLRSYLYENPDRDPSLAAT